MSEDEILSEREKLLQSLDPNIVKFLMDRRSGAKPSPEQSMEHPKPSLEQSKPSTEQLTHDMDIGDEIKPVSTADDVVNELLNKYPHMNQDEPEKREWMANIPEVRLFNTFFSL